MRRVATGYCERELVREDESWRFWKEVMVESAVAIRSGRKDLLTF